jgi:hypothetical protein
VDITISAEAVAWYGAIVGTGSLAVSALNAWRDRPRVRVTADAGYRIQGGEERGYSPDKLYISVTVANRGRRPVTIEKVWFDTSEPGRGPHILLHDSLLSGSRELAEGKATTYLADQALVDLRQLTRVTVSDQTGRTWSGKPPKPSA